MTKVSKGRPWKILSVTHFLMIISGTEYRRFSRICVLPRPLPLLPLEFKTIPSIFVALIFLARCLSLPRLGFVLSLAESGDINDEKSSLETEDPRLEMKRN